MRTDFRNSESVFALELRVPDIPVSISRMQAINSFALGLAYYITDNGEDSIDYIQNGSIDHLKITGRHGLDTNIDGTTLRSIAESLLNYSESGLRNRGFREEARTLRQEMSAVLRDGNDATAIRDFVAQNGTDATLLRNHLIESLRQSQ
jgi:gamma-glutamylcysteine synthetase